MTSIPDTMTAGDTLTVTLTESSYPASTHSLSFAFSGPGPVTFSATTTESGDDYILTLLPAATADRTPGVYQYQGRAIKTADGTATVIILGSIRLLPNLFATATASVKAQLVASLEVAINSLATKTRQSISVNGKNYTLVDISALHALLLIARRELRLEKASQRPNKSNLIRVTFSKAS